MVRNQLRHGGIMDDWTEVSKSVNMLAKKHLNAPVCKDPKLSIAGAKTSWQPPPLGCLKMNFDSNFKDGEVVFARVTRNHEGNMLSIWVCQDSSMNEMQQRSSCTSVPKAAQGL